MAGMSSYLAQALLAHSVGKTAYTMPTCYIGLLTLAPTDDSGASLTEVSGSSYARVATSGSTWNAATGIGPSYITNAAAVTFAVPTGSWGTCVAVAAWDSSTSGGSNNLLFWDFLGPYLWLPVTLSHASPAVWTSTAHGYSSGDTVVFTNDYGGAAPTLAGGSGAIASNALLTVQSGSLATDSFNVVNAGSSNAVNTSTTGDGSVRKVSQIAISAVSGAMSFAAGQLQVNMT